MAEGDNHSENKSSKYLGKSRIFTLKSLFITLTGAFLGGFIFGLVDKDSGHMFSWLIGYIPCSVGWGYAEPGRNLLLASSEDWRVVVPSGVLSHMGKHGLLILTEPNDELPDAARSYLQVLKPSPIYPSQQVFNFAWVLGKDVNNETVRELDELLQFSPSNSFNNRSVPVRNNRGLPVGNSSSWQPNT